MGNFTFNVPSLGSQFVDYRDPIVGDSYNWSWVRPLSQPQYLVIHHSAGPDSQTPQEIAAYHVNSNGWGGIGYHFVISKTGTVYYVGDLTTARASVLNLNHLVIGICLIGSFINGKTPPKVQLQSAHELCAQLLFRTPELSGVDSWEDVVGHRDLQATACPGDSWSSWRQQVVTATTAPSTDTSRVNDITNLYQVILGRNPDSDGLNSFVQSNWSIEEIRKIMTESQEHKEILNKAKNFKIAQTLANESISSISNGVAKLTEITKLGQ